MAQQQAIVAGGCFWCTEAVMKDVIGVSEVESGYIGGDKPDPTYKEVCTGNTGHAEGVRVTFDDAQITLGQLYDVFLGTHDPTQLNRQGNDIGSQYRSAVFYESDAQKQLVQAYIRQLDESGVYPAPVVTSLEPLTAFYPAEAHHQNFAARNPFQPYIMAVAAPKMEKLASAWPDRLKPEFSQDDPNLA